MVRNRAQLLLASSIVLAIIFVGFSIVLNSVIFTENIAGGSSIEVTGDVDEFDHEMRRNARSLTIRVNHAQPYNNTTDVESAIRENFTSYSGILAETYADGGSVYVNVTFDSSTVRGRRIVQSEDRELTKDDGSVDWSPFAAAKEIGWFRMNIDATNVSTDTPYSFELTNESGDTLTVSIKRSGAEALYVNSTINGAASSNTTCEASKGRVYLNILDGTSFTDSCTFDGADQIESPYTHLEFTNGDAAWGKYSIVLNESGGVNVPECTAPPQALCLSPAVWRLQITTRYSTADLTYRNVQTIDAYEISPQNRSSNAILVVSAATGADNHTVHLVLNNSLPTDTTVTHISVDSTNASNTNWVRSSGNELTTNRTGWMDKRIKVGGSERSLDQPAVIPSDGATNFTLRKFGRGKSPTSSDTDMYQKSITFTLYFADGSNKQFTTTVPYS